MNAPLRAFLLRYCNGGPCFCLNQLMFGFGDPLSLSLYIWTALKKPYSKNIDKRKLLRLEMCFKVIV